jgi:hypothetical protein
MAIWTPSPKQLLAREGAEKLAAAVSRSLPGEVALNDLLKLNTEARKSGARYLLLVPPEGDPVGVSVNHVTQLRHAKGALKRKRATVRIQPDGVHVVWSTGHVHLTTGPFTRQTASADVLERVLPVLVGSIDRKEVA